MHYFQFDEHEGAAISNAVWGGPDGVMQGDVARDAREEPFECPDPASPFRPPPPPPGVRPPPPPAGGRSTTTLSGVTAAVETLASSKAGYTTVQLSVTLGAARGSVCPCRILPLCDPFIPSRL